MNSRKVLTCLLAALATALLVTACGGGDDKSKDPKLEDSNPDKPDFHVAADADQFGGPTPLKVKFYTTPFHESGTVHWRWRFDDGTYSEEKNPIHTFTKPGYYQVLMSARDAKGQDHWNLIVGAWPPKLWEAAQKRGSGSTTSIKDFQKQQGLRTGKRRKAQYKKSRQRAAQHSTASPGT